MLRNAEHELLDLIVDAASALNVNLASGTADIYRLALYGGKALNYDTPSAIARGSLDSALATSQRLHVWVTISDGDAVSEPIAAWRGVMPTLVPFRFLSRSLDPRPTGQVHAYEHHPRGADTSLCGQGLVVTQSQGQLSHIEVPDRDDDWCEQCNARAAARFALSGYLLDSGLA